MRLIISTMKDEGPFILEWIAYYQSIGFTHFLVASNDCSDGTDLILKRLEEMGIVAHLDNPGPWPRGPQASAYDLAMKHPWYREAEWILVCDADEFLDIRVGDGTLDALFAEVPEATVFSFVWQLFGHSGKIHFTDDFVTESFTRAAHPAHTYPHLSRAMKTLFRNNGIFRYVSTHRPRGVRPRHLRYLRWVDGAGDEMGTVFARFGWHFTNTGIGFGDRLGRMNHYAVRSIESYLMKRLRGDVNTTRPSDKLEGTGEKYFRLHCWNHVEETSILARLPRTRAKYERLKQDPVLQSLHEAAVRHHRVRIDQLMASRAARDFINKYKDFSGNRTVTTAEQVVMAEDGSFSRETFKARTFIALTRNMRLRLMLQAREMNAYPWFGGMDCLGTPTDPDVLRARIDAVVAEGVDILGSEIREDLPLPEQDTVDWFLDPLSELQPAGNWVLLGLRNHQLVDWLLAKDQVRRLYVVDPWGFRHANYFTQQITHSRERLQLDRDFFAFVERYVSVISSGRLHVQRGRPDSILKLYDDAWFDGGVIAPAQRSGAALALMTRFASKLKPGGHLVAMGVPDRPRRNRIVATALASFLESQGKGFVEHMGFPSITVLKKAGTDADATVPVVT